VFCEQLVSVPRLCTDSWRNVYQTVAADWLHDSWEGKELCQSVSYQLNFAACYQWLLLVTSTRYIRCCLWLHLIVPSILCLLPVLNHPLPLELFVYLHLIIGILSLCTSAHLTVLSLFNPALNLTFSLLHIMPSHPHASASHSTFDFWRYINIWLTLALQQHWNKNVLRGIWFFGVSDRNCNTVVFAFADDAFWCCSWIVFLMLM